MGLHSIEHTLFPPIVVTKEFISPYPTSDCHNKVGGELGAGGVVASAGALGMFAVAMSTPGSEYPVSVDVSLSPADGEDGTHVTVTASYVRPPTFMGGPAHGPLHTKWLEACDDAVDLVTQAALPTSS